jgi:hypothetical protein
MSANQPKHTYPLTIALRAQKLIQGSVFYGVFVDMAAGQYVRLVSDPAGKIKHLLLQEGLSEETYEVSWECFREYMDEFQHPIYQHGLYSMVSHWDWYISRLGKFINFARKYYSPQKSEDPNLSKLNRKPFKDQISILKASTGVPFSFQEDSVDLIEEMNLVRNLGMHNEWEVDEDYLKKSRIKNWKIGRKREFNMPEIEKWHSALLNVISVSANDVARNYAKAPKYE